jgi:hypothetical protein
MLLFLINLSQRNDIKITNIHLAQTNGNISIFKRKKIDGKTINNNKKTGTNLTRQNKRKSRFKVILTMTYTH